MNKNFRVVLLCFLLGMLSACHTAKSPAHAAGKTQPFTFFVLGDWGTKGKEYQLPVARQMIRQSGFYPLSMIVTVGDNFYEDGVQSIADEHWKLSYEDIYGGLAKQYPWYVALGNHDYRGNVEAQIAYHSVNPNWNLPAYYYTFVKEANGQKVRFVIMDTDPYITDYYSDAKYRDKMLAQDTAKQTRWIDSVLSASTEEWKLVLGHHPLYAVNAKPGEANVLRSVFQPIFDRHHVQAYICGHDHIMQFNRPAESRAGYIISGGGARPISKSPREDFTLFSSNAPGFTICSIEKDKLAFSFIDTTGKAMYQNIIPQ